MEGYEDCICIDEQCRAEEFDVTQVAIERCGEMAHRIDLCWCRACGREWLRYVVDHDTSGGWGKWYRIETDAGQTEEMTIERAVEAFKRAKWHFYGGSYYRTSGERSFGPVHVPMGRSLAGAA